MNLKRTALFLAIVMLGSCGPGDSANDGGTGGGSAFGGGSGVTTGGGSGASSGGGSGQTCFCQMSINGDFQQTAECGGLLCFEAAGEYYRCDPSGSTAISSCGSTGGGNGSTGGGSGSTGGGSGATGGGSGSTGGGSGSTGGGSGSTGGGSGSTGGGSGSTGGGSGSTGGGNGAMCVGSFTCGSTTCNSATQYCRVSCDALNNVNTYSCQTKSSSTCANPENYCISYIAVSGCQTGRSPTCSGDDATRGLTYGCACQ